MTEGPCLKFVLDVYDREIERYGGPESIIAAERLFCADSQAVAELVQLKRTQTLKLDPTVLAVLSTDDLLAALGLDESTRLQWYRESATLRKESDASYREKSRQLRALLGDPGTLQTLPGGKQAADVLARRRVRLEMVRQQLSEAVEKHMLTQPLFKIYGSFVHMHCNRLLGIDRPAEIEVLELLLRSYIGLAQSPISRDS